jgi:hypothetical protein
VSEPLGRRSKPRSLVKKERRRVRVARREERQDAKLALADFDLLCGVRLQHVVDVREPLVLVSQIQRSGGTLVSQLFDGHPQCHAHPYELKIGHPRKQDWPPLDLGAKPAIWFGILYEASAKKSFKEGYVKQGQAVTRELGRGQVRESFPFIVPPALQWKVFEQCVSSWPIERERDVLDAYMTSYFNAWLDNHNLYTGPKRIVTGFTPRLNMRPSSLEKMFEAYPDGRLVTVIRDPQSWYVSARRHAPRMYGDLDRAIKLWRLSAQSAIDAKERYGSRVFVLAYEGLIEETEDVMRRLSGFVGIDFDPVLLQPTFNCLPIKANSSYDVAQHGIIKEPIRSRREELTKDEATRIEKQAGGVYEAALALPELLRATPEREGGPSPEDVPSALERRRRAASDHAA